MEQILLSFINNKFNNLDDKIKFLKDYRLLTLLGDQFLTDNCEEYQTMLLKRQQQLEYNLTALRELDRIIKEFNRNDIEYMLVKGLSLSYILYPHPEYREMNDIDLIVKTNDGYKMCHIMENIGFNREAGDMDATEQFQKYTHLVFWKDKLKVEIHSQLFNPPYVFQNWTGDVFRRHIQANIQGVIANTLDVNDGFLYLCTHFCIHLRKYTSDGMGEVQLRHFHDIALYAQYYTLDWDVIIERANNWGAQGELFLICTYLMDFYNFDLNYVLNKIRNNCYYCYSLRDFYWTFDALKKMTILDYLDDSGKLLSHKILSLDNLKQKGKAISKTYFYDNNVTLVNLKPYNNTLICEVELKSASMINNFSFSVQIIHKHIQYRKFHLFRGYTICIENNDISCIYADLKPEFSNSNITCKYYINENSNKSLQVSIPYSELGINKDELLPVSLILRDLDRQINYYIVSNSEDKNLPGYHPHFEKILI